MSLCEFKRFCPRDQWRFGPTRTGPMRAPEYGAGQQGIPPAGRRAVRRCPLCNKRLSLRASYCIGGEFVSWEIPDHAVRVTRKKGPRRKSRPARRGK